MGATAGDTAAGLIWEVQRALVTSQQGVGRILGMSRRTMSRWVSSGKPSFSASEAECLARAVFARDPALAERIAAVGGTTLAALGIQVPDTRRIDALARTRFDAVVCAAAEVLDVSPRAVRPALLAAVRCAGEVGLTLTELEAGLQPPASAATGRAPGSARRPPKRVTAGSAP